MFPLRPTEITFEAALRDLGHPDPRVRNSAAAALGHAPPEHAAAAAQALRGALADGRPDVRYAAALSLGELEDPGAVDVLLHLLEDRDLMARQAAVIALGRIGDPVAVEPLIQALRDGPPDVRFQAATSLSELAGDRAVAPLVGALADHDLEVRCSAAAALGDLGAREAVEPLARCLADPVEVVRIEATFALARLRDPRAFEPLLVLARQRESGFAACELLGAWGDRRAVPVLRDALHRGWFVPPQNRVRAAASLLSLGESEARAYLLAQLRHRRPEVRSLTLELLGQVGGPAALEPLVAALDGPLADAAARGLGALGDARARPPLTATLARARAADPPDPDLLADLVEALDRLPAP
jgi:HEAT repeat protein